VRLDPLRWVIEGELGLELEVELWKFISLELVPAFLLDTQPPLLNDFDGVLTQHSDGIGALTGASLGVGFWLDGEPFRGTVLRGLFASYSRTYRTEDKAGPIDEVSHSERLLGAMIGSYNRWGPFTIGGGVGLVFDLNDERRCFTQATVESATDDCDDEQLKIALDREVRQTAGVYGGLHPVQLVGRISLGFVF
jgi:hypothetical protein